MTRLYFVGKKAEDEGKGRGGEGEGNGWLFSGKYVLDLKKDLLYNSWT